MSDTFDRDDIKTVVEDAQDDGTPRVYQVRHTNQSDDIDVAAVIEYSHHCDWDVLLREAEYYDGSNIIREDRETWATHGERMVSEGKSIETFIDDDLPVPLEAVETAYEAADRG